MSRRLAWGTVTHFPRLRPEEASTCDRSPLFECAGVVAAVWLSEWVQKTGGLPIDIYHTVPQGKYLWSTSAVALTAQLLPDLHAQLWHMHGFH